MPLIIPSLDDLRGQVRGMIAARVPGADMALRRAVLPVIAEVIARAVHPVWRALAGWFAAQLFKATMASEYLDREAGHYGITRLAATPAAGSAVFTGTDGVTIPAGTALQSSDGTLIYTTQAAGTLSGGTVTTAIRATVGGDAGNLAAGAGLLLTSAIAGVQPSAVVAAGGLSAGADQETDAALRARLLTRLRQPPQGGAATDYLAWAKLTAGVTRVWAKQVRGAGTVDVYATFDDRADNIPAGPDLVAIQAVIDANRPVTADVLVLAPTADALTIQIASLYPDTSTIRAAIVAALTAEIRKVGPGGMTIGDGVTVADPGGILYRSQIASAIQGVGGIDHFALAAPTTDVTFALGHVPATPTVTFV